MGEYVHAPPLFSSFWLYMKLGVAVLALNPPCVRLANIPTAVRLSVVISSARVCALTEVENVSGTGSDYTSSPSGAQPAANNRLKAVTEKNFIPFIILVPFIFNFLFSIVP